MFGTTHGLAGLVIAQKARSTGRAFLTGLVSHFVLDALPHYQGKKSDAITDGSIGGPALLYFAVTMKDPAKNIAGVAGSLMPDVLALTQNEESALNKVKQIVHPTAKDYRLLLPEIAIAAASLFLLGRIKKNGGRP